jgi:hypothetical protein
MLIELFLGSTDISKVKLYILSASIHSLSGIFEGVGPQQQPDQQPSRGDRKPLFPNGAKFVLKQAVGDTNIYKKPGTHRMPSPKINQN